MRRCLSRLAAILLIVLPAFVSPRAPAATLPAGFSDTRIVRPDGHAWDDAVGATAAPDGRIYVWERAGRVWVIDAQSPLERPLIDLSGEVGAYGELGLTGFALDPSFATNGRVYLFYTVSPAHLASCDSPRTGPAQCRAGSPRGPAAFAATISRLTRYTLTRPAGAIDWRHATGADPASRVVLLGESTVGAHNATGCIVTATVHGAGSLAFGADGSLLASCGDGAGDVAEDTGSSPSTDYAGALAAGLMSDADNVGAFRAQRLDSLSGKVLRLDPATGNGLESNPYFDARAPRGARSRVWVLGLRNPERFAVRPGSGSAQSALGEPGTLYIGDAGRYAWESLDVARQGSLNFGWPLFEGMNADSVGAYNAATVYDTAAPNPLYPSACHEPYVQFKDVLKQDTLAAARWPNPCRASTSLPPTLELSLHTRPAIDWLHGRLARWAAFDTNGAAVALALTERAANGTTVSGPLFGGSHSVGGTFYAGADFPAALSHVYFHADAGAGWIKAFRFDANDNPVAVLDFIDNAGAVRAITAGASGGLYYVAQDSQGSSLHHVTYAAPATDGAARVSIGALPGARGVAATAAGSVSNVVTTATAPTAAASTTSAARATIKAQTMASGTSPLTGTDVGGVTTAGTYGYSAPTFTISGASADVQGAADAFQFDETALSGDGSITARVVTDSAPNAWTKAGVMIRESLAAGATNAFVAVTGANGAVLQYRSGTGNLTTSLSGPTTIGAPYWVRLARNGNLFTGSISADGLSFTPISQVTLPMATSAYAGLALTSHSTTVATATFDSLSVVTAPSAPTGLTVARTGASAQLSWTAATAGGNGIGGYYVYRNGGTTPVATVTGATTYVDAGLSTSSTYTYQVAAFDQTTPTPFVSPLSATTTAAPPGAPGTPTGLAVGTVTATSIALSWTAATPGANGLGGYYVYRNGGSTPYAVVTSGTAYTDPTVGPGTTYTYTVAAFDKTTPTPIASALSTAASATTPAATGGQTWTGTDIGAVGAAGSFAINGNTVVVSGSGGDIWQGADAFQFVSQPFSGNGTMTARVASLTTTNAWTKAGVMIRESLAAGATNAFVAVTPGNGEVMQNRQTTNGASVSVAGGTSTAPYWVRINRTGNVFTGYVSANGTTWTQVSQVTIAMATNAYVGFAVTSHLTGTLATATFDSLTLSGGGITGPSAPTGLAASGVTAGGATLSWTASTAGTNPIGGYYVYRNGSSTPVAIVGGTTYTDSGLTAATTYSYTVAAFDRSTPAPLVSALSTALSVTTASGTTTSPPSAPTSLTATATGTTSIALSWPVATAGTNGIGGYYVYRNGATTPTATVTSGTTYTDTGLSPSTTYTYQVATFDQTTPTPLVSGPSPTASATTTAAATGPSAPATLTATAASASSIALSWPASTAGTNGIGGYYVYRNGATTPTATVTSGTSYTDTGLSASTTYTYQVAAFDKTTPTPLVSGPSPTASATTSAAASAPSTPTGLTATSVGSASVSLSWSASAAGSNGIGGYYVYRNGSSTPTATVTSGTAYTDTGLTASTSYTYQVAAFDKTTPTPLVSTPSGAISVTTAAGTASSWSGGDIGGPSPAGSYSTSGSTITVNGSGADIFGTSDQFQFVSQAFSGNGTLTARVVSETSPNVWTKAGVMFRETLNASATQVMVAVTPGNGAIIETRPSTGAASVSTHGPLVTAPYWVRLNRNGNVFTGYISPDGVTWTQIGQYTSPMATSVYVGLAVTSHQPGSLATAVFDSISIVTGAAVAPSAPATLTATATGTSSIALSWAAAAAGTNGIGGYYVYRNGATTPTATVTSGTTYTDTGLSASTTYTYTVKAFDLTTPTPLVSGPSPTASATTGTTVTPTAPAAPTGLTAAAIGASSISLSWPASVAGSNGIGGYYVYRNGATTPTATVTSGTAYTDTGLAASTTYTYQVAAFDQTTPTPLVSGLSPVASATTTASGGSGTPPAAPTGVTASAISATQLTVGWTASVAGSKPVAGYLVYRNGGTTPLAATTATSYTDTGLTAATAYTYTIVAYDSSTPTALLSTASATLSTATTALTFTDQDIGSPGANGSASASGGTYTVTGSGADIWSGADAFNFDYLPLSGNGSITARVVSQTNTNVWAKAGVMIRESTAAGATNAFVTMTPGNGAVMQYRTTTNGASTSIGGNTLVAPYWVRLTRAGNVFTGFISPDGVTWTQVSQTTIAMATNAYAGFAVTAHNTGYLSTAVFDSVTVTASATTPSAFTLAPRNAAVTTGQSQQYTATLYGQTTTSINWTVDGVSGGNATVGTISATGLYAPPSTPGTHTVGAVSTVIPTLTATAGIGVTNLGGIYTYHADGARDGQNTQEYALNATNVAAGTFGKLFSCAVDGDIYGQPLYVANLSIGGAVHNVVFVVTMHDSVYAFDADNTSCVNYWTTAYVKSDGSVTSIPTSDTPSGGTACADISTEYGITGTPVIDPAASVIYFVTATKESGVWVQRLHALDLATGTEKPNSPVTISGSSTSNTGQVIAFSPLWENQRPGLALVNGQVYIGWASHCDTGGWHGWMMTYNATTLAQTNVLNMTPGGTAGGIWMSGGAPAVDSTGNVYVTTGNGSFDYTTAVVPPLAANSDYGESYVKFTMTGSGSAPTLTISDFYTPSQNAAWTAADADISASGVIVLPDGAGPAAHPNVVVGSDKLGHIWILDRSTPTAGSTSMGAFTPNADHVVQYLSLPNAYPTSCPASAGLLVQSTPSYWNSTVYIALGSAPIMALPLVNGLFQVNGTTAVARASTSETYGYPSPTTMLSTTPGSTSAILWALDNNANGTDNCQGTPGPAILRAYDATTMRTLYSSSQQAGDAAGNAIKFQLPIIANGHVYVPGSHQLTVYGLLP